MSIEDFIAFTLDELVKFDIVTNKACVFSRR